MSNPHITGRSVAQIVIGRPTSDGAGVRLNRVLTQAQHRALDPFLMLDEFRSDNPDDYLAGFPDHPHRGFETVTYMLAGRMRHRDSVGNSGLLTAGGVQWMTAGRGIIHSEMPEQENGLMQGFQLWINLPAKNKMTAPAYQDLPPEAIPEVAIDGGGNVRVIAGKFRDTAGAIQREDTAPLYLDLQLNAGQTLRLDIPASHNAFLYVYEGELAAGTTQKEVRKGQMALLGSQGDFLDISASSASRTCRAILVAGKPLNEPIVQYGPFVMNTHAEIEQAIQDYQSGKLAL